MSQNPNAATNAPGAFNIGNIVSVGLRLYRSHFKSYFGIAFRAILWLILLLLAYSIPFSIATALNVGPGGYVLTALIIIALGAYCSAKALMNMALISRLAFAELSQKPESAPSARQKLNRRLWGFLLVQIATTLILIVANLLLYVLLVIAMYGVGYVFRQVGAFAIIIILIVILAYFASTLGVYSCFFIPEVPIAVEEKVGAAASIGRCWELSNTSVVRIMGVISISVLIMIPLYALMTLPLISFFLVLAPLASGNPDPATWDNAAMQQFTIAILIFYGLFFLVNLLIIPLWQTIKAVLYYDLRSRREGLDLRLRDLDS